MPEKEKLITIIKKCEICGTDFRDKKDGYRKLCPGCAYAQGWSETADKIDKASGRFKNT